jgi:hypothetical protein
MRRIIGDWRNGWDLIWDGDDLHLPMKEKEE